jgi:hypothetical protein
VVREGLESIHGQGRTAWSDRRTCDCGLVAIVVAMVGGRR